MKKIKEAREFESYKKKVSIIEVSPETIRQSNMNKDLIEKRKHKELIDKWLEDADVSSVDTESQILENREDDAEQEKKMCLIKILSRLCWKIITNIESKMEITTECSGLYLDQLLDHLNIIIKLKSWSQITLYLIEVDLKNQFQGSELCGVTIKIYDRITSTRSRHIISCLANSTTIRLFFAENYNDSLLSKNLHEQSVVFLKISKNKSSEFKNKWEPYYQ